MRFVLISDIHGNSIALDAVIRDVDASGGADRWWVLGDIIALGHDPVGTLERLTALPNIEFLTGNTERYVVEGTRPYPRLNDVANDSSLLPRLVEVTASFAWTRGMITNAGWYQWINKLPRTLRHTLPDSTRLLGVHASPQSCDGIGIDTRISDDDLISMLKGCEADVVFGGHTHDAVDRIAGTVRAVNLGSVSNSNRPDRKASYVVVTANETTYDVAHRTVQYDHQEVIAALDAVHHPAGEYLKQFQR